MRRLKQPIQGYKRVTLSQCHRTSCFSSAHDPIYDAPRPNTLSLSQINSVLYGTAAPSNIMANQTLLLAALHKQVLMCWHDARFVQISYAWACIRVLR